MNQKKAGVAILITDKIDFKMKDILQDKEGHYIMIKGSIQEEDITILNIYTPNIDSPQHLRRLLTTLKGEIKTFTDKQKLREFSNTKPALQQILKELL